MELRLLFLASLFMLRKNDCNFLFSTTNFKIYSYVVIANVVISWLIAFNILNTVKIDLFIQF